MTTNYVVEHGYVVVDTMGDAPTLLWDDDRVRAYASISRRRLYPQSQVTKRLLNLIEIVRATAVTHVEDWSSQAFDLAVAAVPVLGPPADPGVFGVVVHFAPSAARLPQASRTIGTMMWEPTKQITYHSTITETEILGNDPVQHERVSAEVFRHFQYIPREHDLGPWVQSVMLGGAARRPPFEDVVELKRCDEALINVHLSMRAVEIGGEWRIRGLIHDISDSHPPTGHLGYDRRTARSVAQLTREEPYGIALVSFSTRVIVEWLSDPPSRLRTWTTANAQWEDDAYFRAVDEVAARNEPVECFTRVNLGSAEWIPVVLQIQPATPGGVGNGLMRVEFAG